MKKKLVAVILASVCLGISIPLLFVDRGLEEPLEPEPTQLYNTSLKEIKSNPAYWNMAWKEQDYELQEIVQDVNDLYFETHTYVEGETDCNDMACDVWNMLLSKGITSIIVIGNLDLEEENFAECNHAWLWVYNSTGTPFALEPTNGELIFAENPEANQYGEGFFYTKPSDLRADIGKRW